MTWPIAMQQLLILMTGHPNKEHIQSASGALCRLKEYLEEDEMELYLEQFERLTKDGRLYSRSSLTISDSVCWEISPELKKANGSVGYAEVKTSLLSTNQTLVSQSQPR